MKAKMSCMVFLAWLILGGPMPVVAVYEISAPSGEEITPEESIAQEAWIDSMAEAIVSLMEQNAGKLPPAERVKTRIVVRSYLFRACG